MNAEHPPAVARHVRRARLPRIPPRRPRTASFDAGHAGDQSHSPAQTTPPHRATRQRQPSDDPTYPPPRRARPRWHRVIAAEGYAGAWLEHVREQNVALWHPDELPEAECRSIAKSCANYSLRQFSETDYSAIQTQRNALVLESGLQKSGSQLSYDCRFLLRRATIVGPKAPTRPRRCSGAPVTMFGRTPRKCALRPRDRSYLPCSGRQVRPHAKRALHHRSRPALKLLRRRASPWWTEIAR